MFDERLGIKSIPYEERLYTVIKSSKKYVEIHPRKWEHIKEPRRSMKSPEIEKKEAEARKGIRHDTLNLDKNIFIKTYSEDIRKTLIQEVINSYNAKNELIALIRKGKMPEKVIERTIEKYNKCSLR